MQENREFRNVIDSTSSKEFIHNGQTYVMTDKPYTQPPIFNLIEATKYKGIRCAIITSIILYFIGYKNYVYVLPADIIMIIGFVFMKYWLLPSVVRGKVNKVAALDVGNVNTGKWSISLIRSALLRPFLMMAILLINADNVADYATLLLNGLTNFYVSYFIGIFVVGMGLKALLLPAKFDVKDYHTKVIRFCKNEAFKRERSTGKNPYVEDILSRERENIEYVQVSACELVTPDTSSDKKSQPKAKPKVQPKQVNISEKPKEVVSDEKTSDVFKDRRVFRGRRNIE